MEDLLHRNARLSPSGPIDAHDPLNCERTNVRLCNNAKRKGPAERRVASNAEGRRSMQRENLSVRLDIQASFVMVFG
jgi:hypothetical protein